MANELSDMDENINQIFEELRTMINTSRNRVYSAVNTVMLKDLVKDPYIREFLGIKKNTNLEIEKKKVMKGECDRVKKYYKS